jgi:hypothetical protein
VSAIRCGAGGGVVLLASVLIGAGNRADAGSPIAGGAVALDRIALAVDRIESSYGTDPLMWRADPDGPQGPMQVSAAAAADIGGGNRFDIVQNWLLGRAYLSGLYRRYGNWPDAVAAYNWGPGNMNAWIDRGRQLDAMPATVALYRVRVMNAALYGELGFGARRRLRRPHRSLADRLHPSRATIIVEGLYGEIMRLSSRNFE